MGYANGNIQIINGQEYQMYSPAWYAAMEAEKQRKAASAGTAAGTSLAAASKAAGIPLDGALPAGTTAPSVSTGGTTTPAVVPPPSLSGLTAAVGAGSGPGTGTSSGSGGYAHLAPVDTSAADSAAFNRAKDQVGLTATRALTGLRSALGGRGMLGSGLEERATLGAATAAEGQLGDVSRQQAITKADTNQKNAQANFEGDITQRGQDFQKEEAGNSLAGELAMSTYSGQITQRGQDISAANAAKALELESAQLAAQQRSTALAGLEAALKISPGGSSY